ncbi:molybdopterin-dependent oxidoreductase [Kibdelosporangium phytohabitans]|uniref:Molybdopterin oxidoreductase n=1 Tax=Kibdelosporangium phytohabitans TaxID=860235 RepID=A0A0N9HVX0_9PSEU|nr:molybdopterin-dependent oxidoreductase [Kibdelosporangium phytohabitans]ALG05933.1 molybdopterin oxidoreductase [Kibdelosporangium phytohabitans]MBE1466016.1 anaerobic selenocysteine-containing dehydrogenase [Kibdelosporangium phytohabitans]
MDQWHKSACILCACNCGIEVLTEDRLFKRIRGDKDHVASEGYTCNKALRLEHYQNGSHRLASPMRRTGDGEYEPISWDTAIAEIADRLRAVRDTHGGDKIFFYGGGGQGNHLGGAYSSALLRGLGSRYRSNALAQEKTGEFWVDAQLYKGHTAGDFEHAEVAVFVGKNPWQSHGIPRARVVLKEIARDPVRSLIVIDPVRTETADLADLHLRVKPGTDAWCLAAMAAVLVQEDLVDHDFLAERTTGFDDVVDTLAHTRISDFADRCGVGEELIVRAARRIGTAGSVSVLEDLGVQMAPHSTLNSYVNKLLWLLTGNFAKQGAMSVHSWLVPLADHDPKRDRRTPVTGARIIANLVPCNVIAEEILTDHPDRFRAMIIESANPSHSLADSQRFNAAMAALDLTVVIDVAMTETARRADYVLPAASQFEKWEATFFNLEFPRNTFHLRAPVVDPLPGTLPEAEIYARLVRALGLVTAEDLAPLHEADDRQTYAMAMFQVLSGKLAPLAPFVAYETLGPKLPDGAASAAVLWLAAHKCAMTFPDAVKRAGHADGEALFEAILSSRSGVPITLDDYAGAWRYVGTDDGRIHLAIPSLLDELRALDTPQVWTSEEFPFVLSAGERRAFTANTIIRNPEWRRRDKRGALRVSPQDAEALGLRDEGMARVTTTRGSVEAAVEISDRMQPGHVALPNGLGLDYEQKQTGASPNDLTDAGWRDPIAGTPWHKHVPASIQAVS